jgi:Cap4 SAVED domain
MSPVPPELLSAIKGNYTAFSVRLKEIPYDWQEEGMSVSGKFFYLNFQDGQPTVDEFVEFLYWNIIPFCIPRREREEQRLRYSQTGDERYIHELTDKARNLFIRAKKRASLPLDAEGRPQTISTGEPGELILFMLLEAARGAPQIACKMYLKTSEQMPVHGSDSIHISHGSQAGSLRLIWGESKLYQQLSAALDEICASIAGFLSDEEGRTHRDRDIDVLKDHVDIDDPAWRAALLKFFDPYEPESNLREEGYACFVGFDYGTYANLTEVAVHEREQRLRTELTSRIASACSLFAEKLRTSNLSHLRIDFFLIPFPSVSDLRRKFLDKLGVPS